VTLSEHEVDKQFKKWNRGRGVQNTSTMMMPSTETLRIKDSTFCSADESFGEEPTVDHSHLRAISTMTMVARTL
jgi:hypothetical protein